METAAGPIPVVKSVFAENEGVEAPGAVVLKNTETVLEPEFVTAKSGLPSPLRSPIETEFGPVPVLKSLFAENVGVVAPGVVVFKNTETVVSLRFGTARSGLPSPLRSPIKTDSGPVPVVKSVLAENEGVGTPIAVVFNNTETVPEVTFATARSNLPSPLKSLTESDRGPVTTGKSVLAENEGVVAPGAVVFKNTETVLDTLFGTARSGKPSPLKSAMGTEYGPFPVVKSVFAENVGVVAPGTVVFKNTEIVLEPPFATTRSGKPSPLRSPMETPSVALPAVKSVLADNVGVAAPGAVVFKNTEI